MEYEECVELFLERPTLPRVRFWHFSRELTALFNNIVSEKFQKRPKKDPKKEIPGRGEEGGNFLKCGVAEESCAMV